MTASSRLASDATEFDNAAAAAAVDAVIGLTHSQSQPVRRET
jgi:hypothetical protein